MRLDDLVRAGEKGYRIFVGLFTQELANDDSMGSKKAWAVAESQLYLSPTKKRQPCPAGRLDPPIYALDRNDHASEYSTPRTDNRRIVSDDSASERAHGDLSPCTCSSGVGSGP